MTAPERIVYDHVSGPPHHTEATFVEEAGGRTRVTVVMTFDTAALRGRVAKDSGAVEGLQQTLDRLGEHVAALSAP